MAKINFPDSPTLNQEFTVGNKRYKWDGATWNLLVTSDRADSPTITSVEEGDGQVTFTITNNDEETAVITYEVSIAGDDTPDDFAIELASGATSSNLTVDGLTNNQAYIIYAKAIVVEKLPSEPVFITMSPIEPVIEFMSATGGTTLEYDSGGSRYRSHTFTSNGNFVVTEISNVDTERNKVDYLIIAGGAGGGSYQAGGGGGAGGYRTTIAPTPSDVTPEAKVTVSATSYGITIGLGGAGATISGSGNTVGSSGQNSSVSFPTTITSSGGGGGANYQFPRTNGANGGSGGGGHSAPDSGSGTPGGTGISGQGRNGGIGASINFANYGGGGGGGAGAVGQGGTSSKGGDGGNGLANLLRTGSNETRAGGGGGGTYNGGTRGSGGAGGGGAGGTPITTNSSTTGVNGTANTGGGAGGGSNGGNSNSALGGNGGSGIVVIRYEIATV
jgi:hypothetical protein